MRFGAIDIGSNAVRLVITDVTENKGKEAYNKCCFVRVPLRLGESVFKSGDISEQKSNDLLKTIGTFKSLLELYNVPAKHFFACATASMREATNGPALVSKIFAETGIQLNIVSGQREAALIHNLHIAEECDIDKNYLYIDVGGGSTELTVFADNHIIASQSFPIGTVRYLLQGIPDAEWDKMKNWLKEYQPNGKNYLGIGTGGNINKLYKLCPKAENKIMTRNQLRDLKDYLAKFSLEERMSELGLRSDRADVIVPAAEIFLNILKWGNINEIMVPKLGLVDGIIHFLHEHADKDVSLV